MKTDTKVEGMDRRIFLKSIGWPALGLLSASLLSSRSEAKEPTKRSLKRPELEKPLPEIMELGVEKSESFVKSMIEASEQAKLVQRELEKRDLMPMIERARGFTVYSEIDKKSVAIAVAPFVSDEDVGSLSVSENGLAKGVVVKVDPKTSRVIEFFTIDVVEGKIRTDAIPTPDLKRLGPATLVDKIGRLERPPQSVELSIEQTRSVAELTFSGLLYDDVSMERHGEEGVKALWGNLDIVRDIAQFQLLRYSHSPGNCCCCCSCCCWGSCSCTSA